jgi:hypothetical protein
VSQKKSFRACFSICSLGQYCNKILLSGLLLWIWWLNAGVAVGTAAGGAFGAGM